MNFPLFMMAVPRARFTSRKRGRIYLAGSWTLNIYARKHCAQIAEYSLCVVVFLRKIAARDAFGNNSKYLVVGKLAALTAA